jgi:diguanylate cyclase (GGDEF)-like protein
MTTVSTMPAPQLTLTFSVGSEVALWRTEFSHPSYAPQVRRSERGREEGPREGGLSFPWSAAVKALAAYVLRYAAWGRRQRQGDCPILEGGRGTAAATLNYALSKKPDWLCDMFGADNLGSAFLPDLLKRRNPDLKREGVPVELWLDPRSLPPEQVEIVVAERRVEDAAEMEELAVAIGATCRPLKGRSATLLTLSLPGTIEEWTEAKRDEVLRLLEPLGIKDVKILEVKPGSIRLTLSLPSDQAERLFWAVHSGELDSLGEVGCDYASVQDQALSEPGTAAADARCSLLVVDDEPYILSMLEAQLGPTYDVLTADSAAAAEKILGHRPVDMILTDQRMAGRTGIQLLEWVRKHHPRTVRLLMTGYTELEEAVAAINQGQIYQYLSKPWRSEELQGILRNAAEKRLLERRHDALLAELEERVRVRTSELEQANLLLQQRTRELERLILVDSLTGLFNRRAMTDLAVAELKRHNRYRHPLTIGILDVDFFKQINTEYLLTGGDEVLRGLARTLTSTLREVDSLGRVGGEEFLIIARETNREGAARLAERVRTTVAATPTIIAGKKVTITASLGLAVAEEHTETDFPAMYEVAAAALNEAKRTGRNRFVLRSM